MFLACCMRKIVHVQLFCLYKVSIPKSTSLQAFRVINNITLTSWWPRWRLKSPASGLFTQPFIQMQIKENIKAPRHWPLCGEFTGTGEFPAQKASYAENVSIWWRHHDIRFHLVYQSTIISHATDHVGKCPHAYFKQIKGNVAVKWSIVNLTLTFYRVGIIINVQTYIHIYIVFTFILAIGNVLCYSINIYLCVCAFDFKVWVYSSRLLYRFTQFSVYEPLTLLRHNLLRSYLAEYQFWSSPTRN